MRAPATLLGIALLLCTGFDVYAQPRSTGWIGWVEWMQISRTLNRKNELPIAIQCHDRDTKGLSHRSGMAKVTIGKNTNNLRWRVHAGNDVAMVGRQLEREGMKMVSHSQYRRKSGLVIRCGIWHSQ